MDTYRFPTERKFQQLMSSFCIAPPHLQETFRRAKSDINLNVHCVHNCPGKLVLKSWENHRGCCSKIQESSHLLRLLREE